MSFWDFSLENTGRTQIVSIQYQEQYGRAKKPVFMRVFAVSSVIPTRCKHTDTINVNLGYDFITDMLVLEFELDRMKVDVNAEKSSWLNRAGQSLAEALRLAACQELDIEFTELVTGYRIRQNSSGDYVDIYLYDSLSSGAGYAVSMESQIHTLLSKTRELLEGCTCESACHKCLKHYRNQFVHGMLDRKAALNLLDWGEQTKLPAELSPVQQKEILAPMTRILQRSGFSVDFDGHRITVRGKWASKKLVIYPAMWAKPRGSDTIFISDALFKYAKPIVLKEITGDI